MATKFEVVYLTIFLTSIIGYRCSELPKPTYTRTMLKVSRSLPGETEELKVRTSEGNLATLIVKRRDKSPVFDDFKSLKLSINSQDSVRNYQEKENTSNSETRLDLQNQETKTWSSNSQGDVRPLEIAQIQRIRAQLGYNDEPGVKNVNSSEKQIFKDQHQINNKGIDYGNWKPIGEGGRAFEVEEVTTEQYLNWKPVSSETKISKDDLVLASNFQERDERRLNPTEENSGRMLGNQAAHFAFFPHEPRPLTRTNIGANTMKNRDGKNVPPEVTVRSELNVKSIPKRSPMTLDADGTPVIHGQRVPDDPIDKIQTWRNGRVINNRLIPEGAMSVTVEPSTIYYSSDNLVERQRFERFFKDVNRRYGRNFDEEVRNVYYEWEPKNYQNEEIRSDAYDTKNENLRSNIQKRMLHPESATTFPNSPIYTPESQKIAPLALKPGARAPVLQYAHPELGVQPAKILKNEKRRPDNFPENQHSFTEQRQKKKYVLNDKNIVDSYSLKNYYPNQHFYGLKKPDAPFWVKISQNLKNQFSTGVEKVSQLTRPVFDPLVEATHKISQNLGLSKSQEAQEKIGTVASGSSILIPALGLVASGAALGIGAVAVGRYLDVDVLKRSNDEGVDVEHTRALETIPEFIEIQGEDGKSPFQKTKLQTDEKNEAHPSSDIRNVFLVLEETEPQIRPENQESVHLVESQTSIHRRKRSSDLDVFHAEADKHNLVRSKRFQRKGADLITEIVEIDIPVRGNIDVTELLIPKNSVEKESEDNSILLVEDGSVPLELTKGEIGEKMENKETLEKIVKVVDEIVRRSNEQGDKITKKKDAGVRRRRRSLESDQELEDAFQNLENAEVVEVGHIDGDWTNTPCAKRLFCDAMIQKGPDASMFMEKKMAELLGLIQPGAVAQVSGHFEEVMEAVRRHDCSRFACLQARPGNVFF